VSVTKECSVCKAEFNPTSLQASSWQDLCGLCYSNRRDSVSMAKLNRTSQNSILALEKRIEDMENKFGNIELVVEVSAKSVIEPVIQQYEVRLDGIKEKVEELLKVEMVKFVEEHVAKFQRQIVTLNSRIRELEKDD